MPIDIYQLDKKIIFPLRTNLQFIVNLLKLLTNDC